MSKKTALFVGGGGGLVAGAESLNPAVEAMIRDAPFTCRGHHYGQLFYDVEIQDLKVSLGLKLLYIRNNILYIYTT